MRNMADNGGTYKPITAVVEELSRAEPGPVEDKNLVTRSARLSGRDFLATRCGESTETPRRATASSHGATLEILILYRVDAIW